MLTTIEAAALIGAAILFGFMIAVIGLKFLDDMIGDYRKFKRRRISRNLDRIWRDSGRN